jgi:hypothetical protein
MKPEDLQKAPKLMAENIKIGFSPEYFVVGIQSGSQAHMYSLTPAHAKRLLQYLSHEVALYEEKHGTIEAKWEPVIKSPFEKRNPPLPES